jgi:hypothetical protein
VVVQVVQEPPDQMAEQILAVAVAAVETLTQAVMVAPDLSEFTGTYKPKKGNPCSFS